MDPDIPAPSIEYDDHQNRYDKPPKVEATSTTTPRRSHQFTPASIPLPPSSPMRSAYNTPAPKNKPMSSSVSPRPPSRSPSVASSYRGDRQQTPNLNTKRSSSSLSTARGSATTPSRPLPHLQYRRSSSNLNPSSPATNGKSLGMSLPERPVLTANSVAKEYFAKELEAHSTLDSPVAVIVHDACYGHRFSRPRSTKNALATIVERPERIHATLLGAATAYVRLGGRHQDGPYMPAPGHEPSKVRDAPFRIRKTDRSIPLNHPAVTYVHGTKWMDELQIMCDAAEAKLTMNGKELVRPIGYGKDENGNALPKLHEGDLYLCSESLAALQGCLGGVCDAVDTVFSPGPTERAFVCIRPPGHHCSSNYPSGFCWLNNVHVGISYAAMNHGLTHAAIIDFDLHHGDGSQNIAWDHNQKVHTAAKNAAAHKKTPIGYYSLHDINSYPCEWGDEEKVRNASLCIENAHGQSIWNVHLEAWKSHQDFWRLYEAKYKVLIEKARNFLKLHSDRLVAAGQQPKAAIFISAGFDASEWEGAGMQRHSVNVPTEFYAKITADLVALAQENGVGVNGRLISVLEGGYSDRALTSGVLSHLCGMAGGASELGSSLSEADFQKAPATINNWLPDPLESQNRFSPSYQPDWWRLDNLEDLEAAVSGRQPHDARSVPDKTGNFSSPTQASTAKMTENARERHSLSALQARMSLEAQYVPPPPDVDWAIASYELSRVMIPSERQTLSCTYEELNTEAVKARRERQSNIGAAVPTDERMQLRDRRSKAQPQAVNGSKLSSRNENRRTTIAAISELPDPNVPPLPYLNGRPRRRSSDASSILSSFQGMNLSDNRDDNSSVPSGQLAPASSREASVVPDKNGKAVAVKKTRAPATTKAAPKPRTSPRKTKPTSQPLVGKSSFAKPGLPASASAPRPGNTSETRQVSNSSQDSGALTRNSDDMDNLTNGLKKISIKLNVSSAEDHVAKEQKQLDEKQKKPRAPRKPLLPKTIKIERPGAAATTSKTSDLTQMMGPKPVTPVGQQITSIEPVKPSPGIIPTWTPDEVKPATSPVIKHDPDLYRSEMVLHSERQQQPQTVEAPFAESHNIAQSNIFRTEPVPAATTFSTEQVPPQRVANSNNVTSTNIDTQADRPTSTLSQRPSSSDAFRPMSAGSSTPTRRSKADLPVFTSTSSIPFGSAYPLQDEQAKPSEQPSIWDIPDTPKHK
ncbi:hypothetical protein PV10_07670 [Exophiala mesophila]|uniref:Histone deacetylase domain-containing protein n=1 Tax=Exophiala mesophila TaxID=212818 RepID=A0A0D1Z8H7_EXOME|nr:uncharacterized protein PV10_07670 [Exophiala mesophila]KIV90359.1 hypothetical protein PV10_07670 [Exophiala mesophila]